MRVLINTLPYYNKGEAGLKTYTIGLLRALRATNADMEWHILLRHEEMERLNLSDDSRFKAGPSTALTRLFKVPGGRFAWRHVDEQALLPRMVKKYDVVHYLDSYGPVDGLQRTPLLLTIHDIIPLMDKPYYKGWVKTYLSRLMSRSIPSADFLMVDSEITAHDLREVLGIAAQRMMVVPIGVADRFRPATAEEHRRVVERYQLTAPIVIFVGGISPRKNVARLIRAFARAKREHNLPHHLVLAGKMAWEFDDVLAAIEEVNLGDALRQLGYVPNEDIAPLIAAADAMTFVSLDEGFGLPVVEAMACGTPVLTSNVSSLREVAGNAALLVDPYDDNAISAALTRLCTDPELRTQLRAAGFIHIQKYQWSVIAETVIAIYRAMASRQSPPFTMATSPELDETLKRNAVYRNE